MLRNNKVKLLSAHKILIFSHWIGPCFIAGSGGSEMTPKRHKPDEIVAEAGRVMDKAVR